MDVVEYEKGRRRMCRTNVLKKGSCKGCGAYNALKGRCDFTVSAYENEDENVIEKNIATVEQWVKDNPAKTRQSEFLEMFPNAIKDENGILMYCPDSFNKNKHIRACRNNCNECRKAFWLTEITDNE